MEFLNPAALYAFFVLPLLLVAYLIKGRPRRLVFSSLLFLKDLSVRPSDRPWGRLRLPPLFFLQLVVLGLLILALGEPVFSTRLLNLAIVVDNSASMQALEGQKSRFQLAQEKARDLIGQLSSSARIDLYLTVPRLERVGEAQITPSEAAKLIASLVPYDLGDPAVDYGEEMVRLKKERDYERIFFLTDHPFQGRSESFRVLTIGRPQNNFAITSFHVSRSSLIAQNFSARVEVTNFSDREETVKVLLKAEGRTLAARAVKIAPRKRAEASFEALPLHPFYEAELAARDGLAMDNRRFAVAPTTKGIKLLGISPRPDALLSLGSIPGLTLKVISPQAYAKAAGEGHALEIFHFSTPVSLPQNDALFILPPDKNPLVTLGRALPRPVISGWSEPHPLTRYINFALFRPTYARPLKPLSIGEPVIQSPEGPLAIALEHQGFRYLVLGFDPFPYLGRENLPVSIFTLNLLDWFQEGMTNAGTATGEPLSVAARQGGVIVTPEGAEFRIGEGQQFFFGTFTQGLYQLRRGKEQELRAVNFRDDKESDLNHPTPISLQEKGGASASKSIVSHLWPYLLLVALLLLILEWFFNPPARRLRGAHRSDFGQVV